MNKNSPLPSCNYYKHKKCLKEKHFGLKQGILFKELSSLTDLNKNTLEQLVIGKKRNAIRKVKDVKCNIYPKHEIITKVFR